LALYEPIDAPAPGMVPLRKLNRNDQ